jgi:hypothetical protein
MTAGLIIPYDVILSLLRLVFQLLLFLKCFSSGKVRRPERKIQIL